MRSSTSLRRRLKNVVHLAAVFESNHEVPEGWEEIQRIDEVEVEGLEPLQSDEQAARLVCAKAEIAGVPGVAFAYFPATGWFVQLAHATRWARAHKRRTLDPTWVCVVPTATAAAAGVL